MRKFLSLVLAVMMLLGMVPLAGAEEVITLNVWSFTNELEGMINKYYAPTHPNVKINYVIYPTDGGEYTSKVDAIMASAAASDEAPDIFTLEAAFVKKYVNSNVTADLSKVGITSADVADAFPVMKQIGTSNLTGELKALSWQTTPGVLIYRASLAEKYLGVKTPDAFQAKVDNWDLFLNAAEKVNAESDGAVKMVTGINDVWNAFIYGREQGWVVDGKLVIDPSLYDYLDLAAAMETNDLHHKSFSWSSAWFDGMKSDTTLCYFLPTWGLHYTLKPNCGPTTNGVMTDEELKAACEQDGGTYGDWRIVPGPVSYNWGGTWIGANAAKVDAASAAKKAAIKDFMLFFSTNEDFLYAFSKDTGDFISSNKVINRILDEGGTSNPFLSGQDHIAVFAEAANLINGAIVTEYDEKIDSLWRSYVVSPYVNGEVELDDAITTFKAEVSAQFPELIIEDEPSGLINSMTFPDAAFRAWVKKNCDQDGDGILSSAEAAAVTAIDLRGVNAGSVQGIHAFPALKAVTADCSNTSLLSSLNLYGYADITTLSHNEVRDAAVTPTQTAPGKTAGKHCSLCSKVLVAQREIPKLGGDYVFGDMDNNGKAEFQDTLLLLQSLASWGVPVNDECADVNQNGGTDLDDVLLLLGYWLGEAFELKIVDKAYVLLDANGRELASFEILDTPSIPETGDHTPVLLWCSLMAISIACLAWLMRTARMRERA